MLYLLICLVVLLAVGFVIAVVAVRSTRVRQIELERIIEQKERAREAENLEFFLNRLESLRRQTGFNPAQVRQEAKKALDELREDG